MSKTIRKMFFAWQFDKEKEFLQDMALKGFKLEKVSFRKYTFSEIEPKELTYQMDFRIVSKKKEADYLSLFNDWEYITKYASWYYFVYKGVEDKESVSIYNDISSQKHMFGNLLAFISIVGFPLYYQLLFFIPLMNEDKFTFPSIYFFYRIMILLLIFLHIFSTYKIFTIYRKLGKSISE